MLVFLIPMARNDEKAKTYDANCRGSYLKKSKIINARHYYSCQGVEFLGSERSITDKQAWGRKWRGDWVHAFATLGSHGQVLVVFSKKGRKFIFYLKKSKPQNLLEIILE